ncbi:Cytochrome c oxidase subunit 6a protein [Thalictrum thalictroides]|uniref:Cytochrome c oxidase subunit 6a protein n=1 Tax=Thalictrum thalictroides TaxID=46969 RepID=A0A7J6XDN4_THATH|nr:Cytochrome c oxidase subunit 6a protein [Thalictrum thalictroides]
MAMAMMRSGFQTALRRGGRNVAPTAPSKRGFASSSHHDDAYETAKWEKITYLGIAACSAFAIYALSKRPHFDEPPAYSYMHIRNKEFPWEALKGWHFAQHRLLLEDEIASDVSSEWMVDHLKNRSFILVQKARKVNIVDISI